MKRCVIFFIISLSLTGIVFSMPPTGIPGKAPVVIEAVTHYASVSEALTATKNILLTEQFILQGQMEAHSFTAKRTTGAEADYYIADVAVSMADGKAKVTVTFLKIGTGLLKLEKVAEKVKTELEKP